MYISNRIVFRGLSLSNGLCGTYFLKRAFHCSVYYNRGKLKGKNKKRDLIEREERQGYQNDGWGAFKDSAQSNKDFASQATWPLENEMTDKFISRVREGLFKQFNTPELIARANNAGVSTKIYNEHLKTFLNEVSNEKVKTLSVKECKEAICRDGQYGISQILLRSYLNYLAETVPEKVPVLLRIRSFVDFRNIQDLYPKTRMLKRKIIMHVGPTNSGKTYRALKKLEKAETGLYCSPLRLLAHEIYDKMNGLGRPCMLLTGESKRNPVIDGVEVEECFDKDGEQIVPLVSSTIEMVNLSSYYQVAVIDEIQMLQDARRGQGWTSALLGLKAMEIHLCGEETAVPLVKRIFESCGEEVTVIKYERLSGLEVSDSSLNGTLEGIRDGDCIVAFSRKRIFELQRQIQSVTRRKCALIYGSLPPENRALQAQLFNDPNSEYKVLVASDAIGMGLNLKIQRVIFENVTKYDGIVTRHLSISQLKQIGGRAGRFSFASGDSVGQVTSLYSKDLSSVKKFMFATPEPIPKAGFFPSTDVSEAFFYEFPEKSTLELLDMIYDTTIVPDDYFIADISTMKKLAVLFSGIDLPVKILFQLLYAPIQVRDPYIIDVAKLLAQYLARNKPCPISDVFDIPRNPPKSKEHLAMYESLHKSVLLYLWLGYHFPTIYVDLEDAQKYKLEVEQLIQKGFLKR